MTKLEIAFAEAAKLPVKEQEALANWILEEIASEKRWSELFTGSQDALSKLADEALNENHTGNIAPLDPNKL
jgi:hypothetical protein